LDASDAERAAAAKALEEQAATTRAILLEKRQTAERELALRIDNILVAAYGGIPVGPGSPCLPHGVECHDRMVIKDPCPTCGLGRVAPAARRFLRFLGSPEAAVQAVPPRSSPAVQPY
jgi:hypothetical protein